MAIELHGVCPLLQVFDMAASIRFYRDLLGFEVVRTSRPGDQFDWAWLELGSAQLMLNTAYESDQRPPAPDPARVAAHGDTALYFRCPDLDSAYAHLRARGLEVAAPVIRPYGMRQLQLSDPDGYDLCLQWPA